MKFDKWSVICPFSNPSNKTWHSFLFYIISIVNMPPNIDYYYYLDVEWNEEEKRNKLMEKLFWFFVLFVVYAEVQVASHLKAIKWIKRRTFICTAMCAMAVWVCNCARAIALKFSYARTHVRAKYTCTPILMCIISCPSVFCARSVVCCLHPTSLIAVFRVSSSIHIYCVLHWPIQFIVSIKRIRVDEIKIATWPFHNFILCLAI